jgi:signal peptidase II
MSLWRVSLLAAILDQASKYLVVKYFRYNDSITLIHNFLNITYIQNSGAAFGFMANTKALFRIPFFVAITFGAGLIVYSYQRFIPFEKKWTRFALGLIWGGAMGNFIDRIFYRKVVDFIDAGQIPFPFGYHFSYIFNLADSCITVGLTILVLGYWLEKPSHKKEN